ncbi:MAG: Lipid-A-disaccharide synthase [Fimbriimonadaceae bacterium]|nr:Lipid-A-disaccharide synthase [Fimbriimonadaceae bacterium]
MEHLLRVRGRDISTWTWEGNVGAASRNAGIQILADSSSWGAIGLGAALRSAPKVFAGLMRLKRALRREPKGLFIPIDFGFANVKAARIAKSLGWKVLYFMPPGSWRRDRQAFNLASLADAIVTPFSWSAEMLSEAGASAYWFGHPLLQRSRMARTAGEDEVERRGVAVLPGSRFAELGQLLPVIAKALRDFGEPVTLSVAPTFAADEVERGWRALSGREGDHFERRTHELLRQAKAGIICSGTATLEAAICGCPQVVVYRLGWVSVLQVTLTRFRPQFVSLPNILLAEHLVPELIQGKATPEAIRERLEGLLAEGAERDRQLEGYRRIREMLGPDNALDRTAELAIDLAEGSASR